MTDSLSDKIEKVKDDHAEQKHAELMTNHDERARAEAFFQLGRMKQNDVIAHAFFSNLTSQTIRAAEQFQKEKRFKALGYDTFDQFLDHSEFSPFTKRQYYDRLALVRSHGDEIYDLMTSVGISVRAQKLLGKGDLAIRDGQLCIGDVEVSLADAGIIKDVLNEMFDEKRTLLADREKINKQNDSLKQQIERGTDEYNELQRNLDALRDGSPHDRAVAHAIQSLLEITEIAGQLPDEAKAAKGKETCETLWSVLLQVKKAYGVGIHFTEPSTQSTASTPSTDSDFDAKIAAAIAEPDNLDNEEAHD